MDISSAQQGPKRLLIPKIIKGLLLALVVLVPLIFWPDFQTVFSLPKLLILRTITAFILVLWLFQAFLKESWSFAKSPLFLSVAFCALSAVLSTVFSTNLVTSLFGQSGRYIGLFTTLNLLLIPVLIFNFFQKREILISLVLSVVTSTSIAIFGLLQSANLISFALEWSQSPQDRMFSTIGHGTHLSAYLAINLCLTLALFFLISSKKYLKFSGLTLAFILQISALFLTGSRGGTFAFIISAMLILVLAGVKWRSSLKLKIKKIAIVTSLIIIVSMIGISLNSKNLQNSNLIQRTSATIQNFQNGILPDRISWILSALSIFQDHPLTGTGISTFRNVYNQYRRLDYQVVGPGDLQNYIVPEAAHSEPFNLLATQGIIGFLAFYSLLSIIIFLLLKKFFQTQSFNESWLILAIIGAHSAYFFDSLFSFGVITSLFFLYFFLGLATILIGKKKLLIFPFQKTIKYLFTAISLVLMSSALINTIQLAQSDFFKKQALLAASLQDLPTMEKNFELATTANPYDYSIFQSYADEEIKTGFTSATPIQHFETAIKNYQTAIALNPNYPSLYYNLGLSYIELLQTQPSRTDLKTLASDAFQQSIDHSPNNILYAKFSAKYLVAIGAKERAIQALKKVLQINPNDVDVQKFLAVIQTQKP